MCSLVGTVLVGRRARTDQLRHLRPNLSSTGRPCRRDKTKASLGFT